MTKRPNDILRNEIEEGIALLEDERDEQRAQLGELEHDAEDVCESTECACRERQRRAIEALVGAVEPPSQRARDLIAAARARLAAAGPRPVLSPEERLARILREDAEILRRLAKLG